MFKIFFIGVLVAVYYFSAISYKPNQDENKEYVKTSNTWKFVELDEKTVKTQHWFNYYFSFGSSPKEKEKYTGKIVEISYVSK